MDFGLLCYEDYKPSHDRERSRRLKATGLGSILPLATTINAASRDLRNKHCRKWIRYFFAVADYVSKRLTWNNGTLNWDHCYPPPEPVLWHPFRQMVRISTSTCSLCAEEGFDMHWPNSCSSSHHESFQSIR
jgi:hypothetical protein